ncbi:MAG: hypothetical protein VCA55_11165 [Verrucomicrobiales bacterium]
MGISSFARRSGYRNPAGDGMVPDKFSTGQFHMAQSVLVSGVDFNLTVHIDFTASVLLAF